MTITDTQIPPWYKFTELWVIPADWEIIEINEMMNFVWWAQPPKFTFIYSSQPWYIRLIQIRDYKKDDFITYIPDHLAQKKCLKDDIMIWRYWPPIFQILRWIEWAYNVALMKAVPKSNYDKEYIWHFLKQTWLLRYIELLSQRSSWQTWVDIASLYIITYRN